MKKLVGGRRGDGLLFELGCQFCKDLMPATIQFVLGRHSVNCWLLGGRLKHTVVSVLKSRILPLYLFYLVLQHAELDTGELR